MRRVRYQLSVKSIPGAPPVAGRAPNPAMLQRQQNVELDQGRPWSGDPYEEGPVSDPEAAYARFGGDGEDVEAWLDRGEDGTLIGWLREGGDLYRYSDAEAWALDVDGAQMQRTDALAPTGDPATMDPGVDPAAEADPFATPGEDPHIGQQAGDGFVDETDPATTEGDPTVPLEDPTDLPDDAEAMTEDPELASAADPAVAPATTDEEEFDNPFAAMLAAAPGEPGDEKPGNDGPDDSPDAPDDDPEDPEEDPSEEADGGADEAAEAAGDVPDDDNPFETDKATAKKRKRFGGQLQGKHLPGQHNQEDHGDWAHGVKHTVKKAVSAAVDAGKEAGTSPKGGSSTSGSTKKASLTPESVGAAGTKDLEAMMMSGDFYDMATIEAVADELDRRDSIDARTRGFHAHTEPGSPEEQALFDSVIPEQWAAWAATASKKPRKRSKAKEIEDAYQDFAQAQYARFLSENRPAFSNKHTASPPFDELSWFMGEAARGRNLEKYGSEELQRFFAADPPQTISDFKAEFYPSYAKAKAAVGSRYLSEHG